MLQHEHNGNEDPVGEYPNQHFPGNYIRVSLRWRMFQQVFSDRFQPKAQRRRTIHDDVDPQEFKSCKRCRESRQDRGDHDHDRGNIDCQLKLDEPLEILVDPAPPLNSFDNSRERIVQQHHIAGFFRYFRSCDPHSDADIGIFDGGSIVDPVSRNGNNILFFL